MNLDDELWLKETGSLADPARRARLMQLLCGGALGLAASNPAYARLFGGSARRLKDGRSIYRIKGEVLVNGLRANRKTRIRGGDTVRTGNKSRVIFAVGGDSFILRDDSEIEIGGQDFFIDSLRILAGRLLSVFAKRDPGQRLSMTASTATIGIRGSGVYLEVEPELTYLCTCYGQVALSANDDPEDSELITSTSHDQPRYITRQAQQGTRIREAPVINHSNDELELLEAIVGRRTPAGFGKESYEK
jgi:hypothetical protein